MQTGSGEAIDGRVLRRQRSRQAVIEALIDLASAGNASPSGAEIAARAGVSVRSIGQIFGTQEALLTAAAEAVLAQVEPPTREAHGPLALRIAVLVARRAQIAEKTAGVRRAIAQAPPSSVIERALARARAARRLEIEATFPEELALHGTSERREVLASLGAALAPGTWDELRDGLGLGRRAAERAMFRTVHALIATRVHGA